MRGSNDGLCIFALDFQLCIADIIVVNARPCCITLEMDSALHGTRK